MLGGMIRIKAAAVVGLDDLQPLLVELMQGQIVAVQVIEDAELHRLLLSSFRACFAHHLRGRALRQDRRGCKRPRKGIA
jgi:hypothetical protein